MAAPSEPTLIDLGTRMRDRQQTLDTVFDELRCIVQAVDREYYQQVTRRGIHPGFAEAANVEAIELLNHRKGEIKNFQQRLDRGEWLKGKATDVLTVTNESLDKVEEQLAEHAPLDTASQDLIWNEILAFLERWKITGYLAAIDNNEQRAVLKELQNTQTALRSRLDSARQSMPGLLLRAAKSTFTPEVEGLHAGYKSWAKDIASDLETKWLKNITNTRCEVTRLYQLVEDLKQSGAETAAADAEVQRLEQLVASKDTEIASLEQQASKQGSKLGELDSLRAAGAEKDSEIQKLQSLIQQHERTISRQKQTIAQNEKEHDKQEGKVADLEGDIRRRDETIEKNKKHIKSLQSQVSSKKRNIENLEGELEKLQESAAQSDKDVANLNATIESHEASIRNFEAQIAEYKTKLREYDSDIESKSRSISELQSRVSKAEQSAKSKDADMQRLKSSVRAQENTIEQRQATIDRRDSTIHDLKSDLDGAKQRTEVDKTKIEQLQADIAGEKARVRRRNGKIQRRDASITQLQAQIEALQAAHDRCPDPLVRDINDRLLVSRCNQIKDLERVVAARNATIRDERRAFGIAIAVLRHIIVNRNGTITSRDATITTLQGSIAASKAASRLDRLWSGMAVGRLQHINTTANGTVASLRQAAEVRNVTINTLQSQEQAQTNTISALRGQERGQADTIRMLRDQSIDLTRTIATLRNQEERQRTNIGNLQIQNGSHASNIATLQGQIQWQINHTATLQNQISANATTIADQATEIVELYNQAHLLSAMARGIGDGLNRAFTHNMFLTARVERLHGIVMARDTTINAQATTIVNLRAQVDQQAATISTDPLLRLASGTNDPSRWVAWLFAQSPRLTAGARDFILTQANSSLGVDEVIYMRVGSPTEQILAYANRQQGHEMIVFAPRNTAEIVFVGTDLTLRFGLHSIVIDDSSNEDPTIWDFYNALNS